MRRLGEKTAQGKLIAHGAGQDEERILLAGDGSQVRLQVVGAGVLLEDVVPQRAGHDGCQPWMAWARSWCRLAQLNVSFSLVNA